MDIKQQYDINARRDYILIVHTALMVVTTLLKLFFIIVLCFYLAPTVQQCLVESRMNHDQVLENQRMARDVGEQIRSRSKKLDEAYDMAARIHSLLETINKQSKEVEQRKGKKESP